MTHCTEHLRAYAALRVVLEATREQLIKVRDNADLAPELKTETTAVIARAWHALNFERSLA